MGVTYALLAGLLVGSFLTVVAHRVPRAESVVGPRSRCPGCGTQIAAYDNVPLFSWLALRGRARCCGTGISPRYPLTELAVGLLFAAVTIAFWGEPWEIALGLTFVSTMVAVTLTDLELKLIPNKILLAASIFGALIVGIGDPGSLPERFLAAVGAGGLLFAAALAYPKGMGLGDVKLAATMGLFLGRSVAPALMIALLVGALFGLALMAREGAAARKRGIPFGPFLALGGIVALFAGDQLIDLYLSTF
jgi:leader peptidase (prepilin peptidase) / N-methyltransferase